MQIIGHDLCVTQRRSTLRRAAAAGHRLNVFTFIAVVSCLDIKELLSHDVIDKSTDEWMSALYHHRFDMWNPLLPLAAFYASTFKWKRLWTKFLKLQKNTVYPASFHRQLSRLAHFSILLIVLMVTILH